MLITLLAQECPQGKEAELWGRRPAAVTLQRGPQPTHPALHREKHAPDGCWPLSIWISLNILIPMLLFSYHSFHLYEGLPTDTCKWHCFLYSGLTANLWQLSVPYFLQFWWTLYIYSLSTEVQLQLTSVDKEYTCKPGTSSYYQLHLLIVFDLACMAWELLWLLFLLSEIAPILKSQCTISYRTQYSSSLKLPDMNNVRILPWGQAVGSTQKLNIQL